MRISDQKKEKICEQILYYLFIENPKPIFTSHIAFEVVRDEEYVKKLLLELKKKKLVIEVKKNKDGIDYVLRSRWKLSNSAYDFYKKHQN